MRIRTRLLNCTIKDFEDKDTAVDGVGGVLGMTLSM